MSGLKSRLLKACFVFLFLSCLAEFLPETCRAADPDAQVEIPAGIPLEFTMDVPPAEVLGDIPQLAELSAGVAGGWGRDFAEATVIIDVSQGSPMLTTRYVVNMQNVLMALRGSIEPYRSPSDVPDRLVDYERVSREFYWGPAGQAYERIVFRAYTVPQEKFDMARGVMNDPSLTAREKRNRLARTVRVCERVHWFDITGPFRHNSSIVWF